MKIYEFIATDESGDCMTLAEEFIADEEDEQFTSSMESLSPLIESWNPIPVQFDGGSGAKELDVYMFDEFVVVNARSLEMFDGIEGIEFLPISRFIDLPSYVSSEMKGYLVHFTRRVSIQAGSEVEYFKGTSSIQSIEKLVLNNSDIANSGLFQIEAGGVSIYCTSELREKLLKLGCSGVAFEPINSEILD